MGKKKSKEKDSLPPPISEISFDPSESDDVEELEFMKPRHTPATPTKSPTKKGSPKKSVNGAQLLSKENQPPLASRSPSSQSGKEAINFKIDQLSPPPVTAKQPSNDSIVKMVNFWFAKADLKTTTIADIYRAVEDHFQIKLSKANRKLVRSRLKELSSDEVKRRLRLTDDSNTSLSSMDYTNQSYTAQESFGGTTDGGSITTAGTVGNLTTITDMTNDNGGSVTSSLKQVPPGTQFSSLTAAEKLAAVGVVSPTAASKKGVSGALAVAMDQEHATNSEEKPSVLRFNGISFVTSNGISGDGRKKKDKHLLTDISGNVKEGHVMALIGPSDSGKSTFIKTLTLEAFYGQATGSVTLNGVTITDKLLRRHCFTIRKEDTQWSNLTCRETLVYAASLFDVRYGIGGLDAYIGDLLSRLGLTECAKTRCCQLSLVQHRLLLLAMAVAKGPTVLFLDEPTTGLDGATAGMFIQMTKLIAKEEKMIVVCSIQLPTAKIYDEFDLVTILSKGREAYVGEGMHAESYFARNGMRCPPNTSPPEFFLDILSVEANGDDAVDEILDTWKTRKAEPRRSSFAVLNRLNEEEDGRNGVRNRPPTSFGREVLSMLHRHSSILVRDPLLYSGRGIIFLVANSLFAVVYFNARDAQQDQLFNKVFLTLWLIALPTSLGSLAVNKLNAEFALILREARNGMVAPFSYIIAKTILVFPITFIFSLLAMAVPGFAIHNFTGFGTCLVAFAFCLLVMESIAECLSVWFEKASAGMVLYGVVWCLSFLFNGIFLPLDDMFWPFKIFYYILPMPYFSRSFIYASMVDEEFETCNVFPVGTPCVGSPDGADVLDGLGESFPLVSSENTVGTDIATLFVMGVAYKVIHVIGVIYRSGRASRIRS